MNLYGLTLPKGSTLNKATVLLRELNRLRYSEGSQAGHRSRRQSGRDLVTGRRLSGCRVIASEQEQLQRDRTKRKSQRRKLRKAGVRC